MIFRRVQSGIRTLVPESSLFDELDDIGDYLRGDMPRLGVFGRSAFPLASHKQMIQSGIGLVTTPFTPPSPAFHMLKSAIGTW